MIENVARRSMDFDYRYTRLRVGVQMPPGWGLHI